MKLIKDKNRLKILSSIMVAGVFLFLAFGSGSSDDDSKKITPKEPASSSSSYESSSSGSNIVSCPKCGKSYNKETWGSMCNTCWGKGKGLK